uniref:Uncharacterized protein n=1 Tax=Pseudomonas phage HRDY3 TaxID=3236930 RepID=A0AB39CDS5_9VIRU
MIVIICWLLVLAWFGYGVWYVYDTRNDDFPPGGRAWWTPIFLFFVGLWAALLILGDGAKEARRRARCYVRDRDRNTATNNNCKH